MRKFTEEERQEIKASYRNAENPAAQLNILADLYATDERSICAVLGIQWEEPPPKKATRQHYSAQFKAEVVAAALQPGAKPVNVADAYGITANTVRVWVSQAGGAAESGPESEAEPALVAEAMSAPTPGTEPPEVAVFQNVAELLRSMSSVLPLIQMTPEEYRTLGAVMDRVSAFSDGVAWAVSRCRSRREGESIGT